MTGQDADEERQPVGDPRVQREVPEVDRGRIDGALQQALEQDEHGRDRHAGEELDQQEAGVGAGRLLTRGPGRDAQPDSRPGEQANRGRARDAAKQQQRRRRRPLPGGQRERDAERDAAGGEQRERDGREPHELARRLRRGPAIEGRTDQEQDRDPEHREHDRPDLSPPRTAGAIDFVRRDRHFHQRLAAGGAQQKRIRAGECPRPPRIASAASPDRTASGARSRSARSPPRRAPGRARARPQPNRGARPSGPTIGRTCTRRSPRGDGVTKNAEGPDSRSMPMSDGRPTHARAAPPEPRRS